MRPGQVLRPSVTSTLTECLTSCKLLANMQQFPRLSQIETLILELLTEHTELYGLEMIDASRRRLKRGTVYVTLNRMEEKGYVKSRTVEAEGRGPARVVYRVTGEGSRVLAALQMAGAVLSGARR